MADWQNKKWNKFSKNESAPEDFVLYRGRDLEMEAAKETETEPVTEPNTGGEENIEFSPAAAEEIEETRILSSEDLQAALDEKDGRSMEETGSLEPIWNELGVQENEEIDYVSRMAAEAIAAQEEKAAEQARVQIEEQVEQQDASEQTIKNNPATQWWTKMAGITEALRTTVKQTQAEDAQETKKEAKSPKVKKEPKLKKPIFDMAKMVAFCKKHKTAFLISGAGVLAAGLIAALILVLTVVLNPLRGYEQVTVVKGNVMDSIDKEGKLEANAHYNIISLIAGTVEESVPEPGDEVKEGEILYRLDDAEAKLAVERAENQLNRTKAQGSAAGTTIGKIYATEAGTVQTFSISIGSKVTPGQVVGTYKRGDGTVGSILSAMAGTIESVKVSRGSAVQAGSLVATLRDGQSNNGQTNSYDQKSDQIDISSAKEHLERYVIKSPVDGVVIEKNIRKGDVVAMTDTETPMMVLVDMNSMRLTVQVDEYMVRNMKAGQKALIHAEALPEETFGGEVTRIAPEGYDDSEGNTVYDVDITIDDPGELKGGMKVKAEIILASATNVLTVPRQALMEADGQNALVLVRSDVETDAIAQEQTDEPTDDDLAIELDEDVDVAAEAGASEEELAFPWISVPRGCRLVTVKYGIADDQNVQIVSGLKEGDVVVYDPEMVQKELIPTTLDESLLEGDAEELFPEENGLGTAVPGGADGQDGIGTSGQGMTEEEIKRQIMEKIQSHVSSGQS